MRTFWLVVCASAGCTFASPEVGTEPGPDPEVEDEPEEMPEARTACDRTDPALRLCVDFDGQVLDRSMSGALIAASQVSSMDRDGDPAAALSTMSTLHLHESPALDIPDRLALDMWIRPSGTPGPAGYWILDNNRQYAASYTTNGTIRCVLANLALDSAALPSDGKFHHVACTWDGARLKVFLDGELSRCRDITTPPILTDGDEGLAIGANLSGTDAAPEFGGNFVGGIDDVRVWARGDVDMCAAAGKTGCRTSCP